MNPRFCLMVSGMLCDDSVFDAQAASLRGSGVDVGVIQVTETSMDGAIDSILKKTPKRFALVGYSLGGVVSMACAARAPERVTHLGLIATNPHGPQSHQIALWNTWRSLLSEGKFDQVVEQVNADMLASGSESWMHAVALRMAQAVGPGTFDRQLRLQATRRDQLALLHQVTAHTTIVAGSQDPLCPVSNHTEIQDRIAGSTLHVYEGAGHLVTLQKPDETSKALSELMLR